MAKRKPEARKTKPAVRRAKPKSKKASASAGGAHSASGTAAVLRPSAAVAAGARPFVPHANYWCGGAVLKRFTHAPIGWQLSTEPRPSSEYRLAGIRVFRCAPEQERITLHRYVLRKEVLEQMRARAQRLQQEAELDDRQAHNSRVMRTDRYLLMRKQLIARGRSLS
jgi:hypothetical protein